MTAVTSVKLKIFDQTFYHLESSFYNSSGSETSIMIDGRFSSRSFFRR